MHASREDDCGGDSQSDDGSEGQDAPPDRRNLLMLSLY